MTFRNSPNQYCDFWKLIVDIKLILKMCLCFNHDPHHFLSLNVLKIHIFFPPGNSDVMYFFFKGTRLYAPQTKTLIHTVFWAIACSYEIYRLLCLKMIQTPALVVWVWTLSSLLILAGKRTRESRLFKTYVVFGCENIHWCCNGEKRGQWHCCLQFRDLSACIDLM